ncbi:MAG: hypothetical protein IJT94_13590, partial [Oscillibacter sp.]|nr:hypothetical protein [Oscillibacter sp.]
TYRDKDGNSPADKVLFGSFSFNKRNACPARAVPDRLGPLFSFFLLEKKNITSRSKSSRPP